MTVVEVPHNRPSLADEEVAAVERVIRSGWLAMGPETQAFEDEFCDWLGIERGHAVAVSSGSAALFLSLLSLEPNGKRVGLPVYSCAALRNAVSLAGGTCRYIDCSSPEDPNFDLQALSGEERIVIGAHMYGIPFDPSLTKVPLIEDCAQAIGAEVNGRKVGLHGRLGTFSFYATKMLTAGGQGGMIVSESKSLVEFIRDYLDFDMRRDSKCRFNLQITDVQAAVGRVQLKKLREFINRRQKIFETYKASGLPLMESKEELNVSPVRYRAVLRTDRAKEIIEELSVAGIRAIVPIEAWELLDDAKHFPNAKLISETSVSLPVYPTLADEDVKKIAHIVQKYIP